MAVTILCPTRGGKASQPNQEFAIRLAQERNTNLLFLYVTNVEFLGLTALPVVVDIESELDEMGEFFLTMAQERAENAGVRALTTVRRGVFRKVVKSVIAEHDIQTVVLGSSSGGTGVITHEYIQKLVEDIGGETGVEFIILHDGEVTEHYTSQSLNNE